MLKQFAFMWIIFLHSSLQGRLSGLLNVLNSLL